MAEKLTLLAIRNSPSSPNLKIMKRSEKSYPEVAQPNIYSSNFLNFLRPKQRLFPKVYLVVTAVLLMLSLVQHRVVAQTYTISSPKYSNGTINNNTGCAPGAKCASYSGTMSITGTITFTQLLGPNLNRASATIVSYSVSDGVNTFNNQNSFIDRDVYVTTNANGNLVTLETLFRQWQIPAQNTTNSFLNELWLTPNFFYIFNAVRCGSQGAPGGCYQGFYESGFSSYINLQPNLMPTYKATNADLSGITVVAVASGESSPAPNFSANQLTYSVTVPFQTSQIKLRPTALHGSATIMVNGTTVVSGADSGVLNLARGVNTFTVTVTAQDGFTKKSYTLSVTRSDPSTDANLSAASISPGTLNQTFSAQTLNYTATVPFSQTTVRITSTRAQNFANITLNGVALSSGVQSNLLPLSVGQNTFNVVVTAEDGQTKKTYVLTIQRQTPSTNAILDFLSFSPDATITPTFLPSEKTYAATVPFSMAKIKFVPTSQDPNATVTVKGITVARGVASGDINLGQGNNIIPVIVTAQDGITKETYTVTITRQTPSNDANLANLLVNNSDFTQTFSPSTTSYSLTVPFRSTTATFAIQTADENATVTVNGRATSNSGLSAPVALNVGSNTIQIRVVAENGTTVKTTTVTLTREAAATDPGLSQLTINTGALSGSTVESGIYKYTASNVLFAVSSVTVTPTATGGVKTNIAVNGRAVASGTASTPISLVVGTNVIKIITTAESGATREHWITITRAQPSGVNDLQSLSLASGTLSPSFSASRLEYTATVADNVSSLAITPVLLDATASIRINGISSANNTARSVNLSFGSNEIFIAIRAENGATKTYKIIVTRSLSANSALAGIGMSAGTLSPTFASGTTAYTATVNFGVANLLLTPQKANEYASVKVNTEAVASSKNMSLAVGVNTFTILVTAQNGSATTTYTVQVTRQAASNVSSLASVSLSSGTVAGFTAATTTYNNITATTSTIKVTASPTDANATLKVNGKTTPNGTASGLIPLVSGVVVPVLVEVTAQDGSSRTTYTLNVTFTPPACSPTETTITENGKNYKVLRFSTVGDCQWQAPAGVDKIDYLVVGGGGGTSGSTSGNTAWGNFNGGGGGGGGGALAASNYQITPRQSYNIKVGAGGSGGAKSDNALSRKASNGIESQFGTVVSKGGGAGGSLGEPGTSGASGGGGGGKSLSFGGNGISGQGFSGGAASLNLDLFYPNKAAGGGGGGAGGTGSLADGPKKAGNGGRGILSSITGTATYYGGGGGGGSRDFQCAGGLFWLSRVDCGVTQGTAGQGGGVVGKQSGNGNDGTDGLGGGAGGVGGDGAGGAGGDGVVVLRYELSPCLQTLTTIVGNI